MPSRWFPGETEATIAARNAQTRARRVRLMPEEKVAKPATERSRGHRVEPKLDTPGPSLPSIDKPPSQPTPLESTIPGTSKAPATPRKRPSVRRGPKYDYEHKLDAQCRALGLPQCSMEYRFHPTRKWRIDLAWPDRMLAVEIDGAVHRIKERFHGDIEKSQALFFGGWRLLRVSTKQVRSGQAAQLIDRALELGA